jgi:hypothetical protein
LGGEWGLGKRVREGDRDGEGRRDGGREGGRGIERRSVLPERRSVARCRGAAAVL